MLEAQDRVCGRVMDDTSFGRCVSLGAMIVTGICNNPIITMCKQVCVCVCVCARACVGLCMRVCTYLRINEFVFYYIALYYCHLHYPVRCSSTCHQGGSLRTDL